VEKGKEMLIEEAKKVFLIEEQGLAAVRERIGAEFEKAVDILLRCPSRVVISGIGKSGIIGQKIAATLNSTGTPSFFLHPVEALHGDLGMVMPTDVVIAISYSGATIELNGLLGSLQKRGVKIIAMTGGLHSILAEAADLVLHSILAEAADLVLDIGVPMEACPLGLAPTASTTATLAMGDALAVVLLQKKQFRASDFRRNHPGGSLGERLKVKVREVMLTGEAIPFVHGADPAARAIEVLNEKNIGAVLILGEGEKILGIVTDGDVRRSIATGKMLSCLRAADIMTANPVAIDGSMLAADALSIMQRHEITVLPIVSESGELAGILHLHDLLGKGEFRFLV